MKTIGEQFKNYKKELAKVSVEQWENLPESGDFTRRNKRLRKELQENQRFYRNSDGFIAEMRDAEDGTTDRLNDSITDITSVSVAKDKVLASQLANLNNKDASSVDYNSYLKQLEKSKDDDEDTALQSSSKISSNVGDYHRNRVLFNKMRESAPNKPGNWIASARLEYEVRKFERARKLIQQGNQV
ncbi:unnamed protein product [Ambrosiozyma monospora]|uniref:Unnamed protein product n=1 Tax=Ambrosiozyma monospora TaxID=43982 RepID=A0ACB5U3C6_AMBMO|nr:unnamed protein product [Ambrosiozyma monospora]